MIRITDISDKDDKKNLLDFWKRSIQSSHINFLLGSGCSRPAINVLGSVEETDTSLRANGEIDSADKNLYDFLHSLLESNTALKNNPVSKVYKETLDVYIKFLSVISNFIFQRKGSLFPKQGSIFTTNYDLFLEKASDYSNGSYYLNDGFIRNPSLTNEHMFSPSEFFECRKKRGYHFDYEVEIPAINLLKLHGSLSWKSDDDVLKFNVLENGVDKLSEIDEIRAFNDSLSIILPSKKKFRDTLLNQTYYDLLRLYSNELEKSNTILISVGFSFADEHLLDITRRALRNPTLKLFIICYSKDDVYRMESKFKSYSNVECVYSENNELSFDTFVKLLNEVHPFDENVL